MTAPAVARRGRFGRLGRVGGGRGWRSFSVVAVTAVVGFLLVGQLRTSSPVQQPLEAEEEGDLARILASLNAEADALREEVSTLKLQLAELRSSTEQQAGAVGAAEEQLASLQVLAGTVPVTGPGVVINLSDPKRRLRYDTLIDIVQELRDAGAEAISVNGKRIGVATAFAERDGRVLVDGGAVAPPYRIAAIGQPATLDGGLKIPGGAVDTATAVGGVTVDVTRQARVDLPALERPPAFRAARPVSSTP